MEQTEDDDANHEDCGPCDEMRPTVLLAGRRSDNFLRDFEAFFCVEIDGFRFWKPIVLIWFGRFVRRVILGNGCEVCIADRFGVGCQYLRK